jgi:hypothetical protein
MYELAYGRPASEEEIKIGIDYLHTEPMKEYEENKNKPKDDATGGGRRGGGRGGRGGGAGGGAAVISENAKPEGAAVADGEMPAPVAADANAGMGMGLMGGMGGMGGGGGFGGAGGAGGGRGRGGRGAAPEVKYEPTALGRYAKILLSSTEFIFIN